MKNYYTIAIDGPSGSGKSTITRMLSEKLGILAFNTGSMYRTIALYFIEKGLDFNNIDLVIDHLKNIKIEVKVENGKQIDILNGRVVTPFLRTNEISKASSIVSQIGAVREMAVKIQRDFALKNSVIMEGRDIGTVVIPNSKYKFFITANPEERAKRRANENVERGLESDYTKILREVQERDLRDISREHSPLKQAEDAIFIDTTNLSIEEVVEKILKFVKEIYVF